MPTPTRGAAVFTGAAAGRLTDTRVRPGATVRHRYPPLLEPSDFTYLGAFRVPTYSGEGYNTFDTAAMQMAVYRDGEGGISLFAGSLRCSGVNVTYPTWAQISIPEALDPSVVGVSGLNRATLLQTFADPSDGHVGTDPSYLWCSPLVYQDALIGIYSYGYGGAQDACCFVNSSLDLSSPSAAGPYALVATDPDHGTIPQHVYGGYAALVPPEWQAALGCKAVCGNSMHSIISVNSTGPSLMSLDVDWLLTKPAAFATRPSTPLVCYYSGAVVADMTSSTSRTSLGIWTSNDAEQLYNPGGGDDGVQVFHSTVTDPLNREIPPQVSGPHGPTYDIPAIDGAAFCQGMAFIDGTRTVLFIYRKGLGWLKYGEGTSDPDLDGDYLPPPDETVQYWYDPDSHDKGSHCYPYCDVLVAYDVNDLVQVKNGLLDWWRVRPYAMWAFGDYYWTGSDFGSLGGGVTWDPVMRRLYYARRGCDGPYPLIHVFEVA